jgi:hypothetical protein
MISLFWRLEWRYSILSTMNILTFGNFALYKARRSEGPVKTVSTNIQVMTRQNKYDEEDLSLGKSKAEWKLDLSRDGKVYPS